MKTKNTDISNIFYLIKAFIATWALQFLLGMTVRNPLTVVFFLVLCVWMKVQASCKQSHEQKAYVKWIIIVVSVLASAATTKLAAGRVTQSFNSGLFKMLAMGIMAMGLWALYFEILKTVIWLIKAPAKKDMSVSSVIRDFFVQKKEAGEMTGGGASGRMIPGIKVVLVSAFICFLCHLPYFLYEYPGIMTADSIVQYEQIIGVKPLSNHHPVIHTFLIGLFYNIGMAVTGNANTAIAFYTVFQMVFMSLCAGVVVNTVLSITKKNFAAVLTLLFFALVPFNAVFAVTIWKDVPFAGLIMLMSCKLIDMVGKEENTLIDWSMVALLAILVSPFRSNAWYAFLVFVPFLIWCFFREWKKALCASLFAIVVVALIKGPVMNGAGVIQPDFTESLSLPLQQIARVLVDEKEVSSNDMELIEAVIDTTYIKELYAPDFADNIKELVRAGHPEVLEENKSDYLGLWIRLFFKHPIEYVRAWYDLEGGYIYPDVNYEVGNIDGIMSNSYGLTSTPLIGGKVVIKTKEILIKLGNFVPLYGMLWSAGTYFWLLVISTVVALKGNDKKRVIISWLMPIAITLTLLIAAPVVDFRYAYGSVMTMPLYVSICGMIIREDKSRQGEN